MGIPAFWTHTLVFFWVNSLGPHAIKYHGKVIAVYRAGRNERALPHKRPLREASYKAYLIAIWFRNERHSPCVIIVMYEKDYVYGLPVISRLNIGQLCMVSWVKVIGVIFLRARLDFHAHIRHPR